MSIRVDVIRLAGDAGFGPMFTQASMDTLTRLVDLAQAAEREACAKACDEIGADFAPDAYRCSTAIRARGTP